MADLSEAISPDQEELTGTNQANTPVTTNENAKVEDVHITNSGNLSHSSSLSHHENLSNNNSSFDGSPSAAPIKISPSQYEHHDVSATGIRSSETINHIEMVEIPVFQRSDRNVFALITFPTTSYINFINGRTQDSSDCLIEYRVISAYGVTQGAPFNERTRFLPGDYCLGLGFRTKEEAEKVFSITMQIITEPISNLMLGQFIFNLYRTLGFEPSHALKFPIRATTPGIPFYRKTRNEIAKVSEQCEVLARMLSNPPESTTGPVLDQLLTTQKSIFEQCNTLTSLTKSSLDQCKVVSTELEKVTSSTHQIPSIIKSIDYRDKIDQVSNQIQGLTGQIQSTLQNFTDMFQALQQIQERMNQVIQQVEGKPSVDLESTVVPQFKEVQKQISLLENRFVSAIKIQEGLITNLNGKNTEKGSNESQSITVVDIEELLEERNAYYSKLLEAEDYIEELQQQLENARPNFVRRGKNEWK